MTETTRQILAVAAASLTLATQPLVAQDDVAIMEEIIVEAPFDVRLDLPRESDVQKIIAQLRLRSETERALELKIANRDPISRLLELTKYSPIPLGASEDRVDTFFLQNALRVDLNPRDDDPLALRR